MTTIALYNLKGGVGKTASTVNLGYLAAADNFKTLIWDIDQQGSATFYFKVKEKNYANVKNILDKGAAIKDQIKFTDFEQLDILPADNGINSSDNFLQEISSSKTKLSTVLKKLDKTYDFVFIDCPPGFNALTKAVFNAVNFVLMPVIPTTLSVRSYNMVKNYLKEAEIDIKKLTCFFTMVDSRKTMHQDTMETLFKDKRFFANYIPYLSDVEKMGIHQAPIMEFANSSYAAKSYRDLWEEIKEGVL